MGSHRRERPEIALQCLTHISLTGCKPHYVLLIYLHILLTVSNAMPAGTPRQHCASRHSRRIPARPWAESRFKIPRTVIAEAYQKFHRKSRSSARRSEGAPCVPFRSCLFPHYRRGKVSMHHRQFPTRPEQTVHAIAALAILLACS